MPLSRFAIGALSCLVLVCLSIAFVDRPLALLMHQLFHRSQWLLPFAGIGQIPKSLAGPALIVAAPAAWLGWRPGRHASSVIACSVAVVIAGTVKDVLKEAFGRTWPESWMGSNPSLVRDGVYGFSPFHGGEGWSSFPSGHEAAIAAVVGVLWWRAPQLRWLWALLLAATAAGLVADTFHFLGDVIAGGYIGFACGRATLFMPAFALAPARTEPVS
jgi:membrane-associated phospholipid phosphatase